MTPLLEETKPRVNKLVAHLTYKGPVTDMNWKWAAISIDLKKVLISFLNNLPPDWAAWFPSARSLGPTGPTSSLGAVGATGPVGPPDPEKATTRE